MSARQQRWLEFDAFILDDDIHLVGTRETNDAILADLTPDERDEVVLYLTVGSVNMDYRSMVMDGEAMINMAGWQAINGMIDFLLLAGLCEWVDTVEELDALLPARSGFHRTISGFMKLAL